MIKQSWGIGWVWGGAAIATALVGSGCGDEFSGGDCKVSHTCVVAAGGDESAAGAGADQPIGGDTATAPGAGAHSGGAGGAGTDCAAACSNGDPADGEETCEEGACIPGNPPPTVISVTPDDQTTDVELDTKIVIQFSEALDPNTVTASNIQILDGATEVTGKLTHAGSKVTFQPAAPLALLAPYTVSVTTGVTDEDGAPLLADKTSAFTTREGAWKPSDVITEKLWDMSAADITSAGDVLVTWIGSGGLECPASAGWFRNGELKGSVKVLSPVGEKLCSTISAATNAAGVASVVWKDHDTNDNFYTRQYKDDAWSPITPPIFTSATSLSLRSLVSPNGTALLLELGSLENIKTWTADAAGAWPAQGTTIAAFGAVPSPSVAFDAEGNGLALFPVYDSLTEFERIVSSQFTAATRKWTTADDLPGSVESTSAAGQGRGAPAVAFDADGNAMVLWANASVGSKLMASFFSRQTGWAEPQAIAGNLKLAPYFEQPGLVFDGQDFVAAWTASDAGKFYTYTARYDLEAGWGAFEKRQTAVADGTSAVRSPRLVGDGRGNLLLVWAKGTAPTFTLVYQRYSGGVWGPITAVPEGTVTSASFENGNDLQLSMNADGLAALSWANYDTATGYIAAVRLASFY